MHLFPAVALDVEPPVAHEAVLVEDGPVRAEEGVRGENGAVVRGGGDADVEGLAAGLAVRVETFNRVKITAELTSDG